MILRLFRQITPKFIFSFYHWILAQVAAFLYGYPSKKMVVVGITGTNGKSSTVEFLGRILEGCGKKVGWTSTVGFKVADKEWANDKKMTMLGRFQTQKLLSEMIKAGCTHAIVETSSQGIAQFRHVGIFYDALVFTNLTPEHIEAHGGFENYKQAKGKLFAYAAVLPKKFIDGRIVPRAAIVNIDDDHAGYFLSFPIVKKFGFGIKGSTKSRVAGDVKILQADEVSESENGLSFAVGNQKIQTEINGRFNVYNLLAAVTVTNALGVDLETALYHSKLLKSIPGRLEKIDEGQPFSVVVDYAYEPVALQAVFDAIKNWNYSRLLHVVGSAGGGRDKARREILGKMSGQTADVTIVTNEDPYDENPESIIATVARGVELVGKKPLRILDRKEAIEKAIRLAQPNDLVLITGKGSEPVMAVAGGRRIPWDDRVQAKIALRHLSV